MKTPREICDALGRDRIATALGVSRKTVNEAVRLGQLPAAWWATLSEMHGDPLPVEVFSFKRAS